MYRAFELSLAVSLFIVAAVISALGYVAHSGSLASRNASNFCDSISVGDNIATLDNRVRSIGRNPADSKWQLQNSSGSFVIGFRSALDVSNYLCWVNLTDGHVIDKQVVARD
jgi:hypothetical protein